MALFVAWTWTTARLTWTCPIGTRSPLATKLVAWELTSRNISASLKSIYLSYYGLNDEAKQMLTEAAKDSGLALTI